MGLDSSRWLYSLTCHSELAFGWTPFPRIFHPQAREPGFLIWHPCSKRHLEAWAWKFIMSHLLHSTIESNSYVTPGSRLVERDLVDKKYDKVMNIQG